MATSDIDTKTATCLVIELDGSILPYRMTFDMDMGREFLSNRKIVTKEVILENMKRKCGCEFPVWNVAKSIYPEHSFYSAFCETGNSSSHQKFNKVATHIINYIYSSDKQKTGFNCFGKCYIVHFDQDDIYDTDAKTFINLYNKVWNSNGTEEREYQNRIFMHATKPKFYVYSDYSTRKYNKLNILKKLKSSGKTKKDCIIF